MEEVVVEEVVVEEVEVVVVEVLMEVVVVEVVVVVVEEVEEVVVIHWCSPVWAVHSQDWSLPGRPIASPGQSWPLCGRG